MTIYLLIALPAAGGIICWALGIDLDPRRWFAGSGKRRFTRASAAAMAQEIGELSMQLAQAKRPKPCPNCHHVADGIMPTDAEIAESDRTDPAPRKAASWSGSTVQFAETARDTTLSAMALPGEEEMAAFLERERAKAAAERTEAVTETLPAVTVKSLHEALNTVPPLGDAVREVSAVSADRAVLSVAATVGSAS